MRFVTGIDNRTSLHGVDALELAEKIAALGYLKLMGNKTIFLFNRKLTSSRKNLASHQECLHPLC